MKVLKTNCYFFQEDAYNKIKDLKVSAFFMDMGTGKTRTAIELIKKRFDQNKIDNVFWFCPVSLREELKKEIEKHSNYITSIFFSNLSFDCPEIAICGIETVSMSSTYRFKINEFVTKRSMLIIDESDLIKNHDAIRTKFFLSLSKKVEYKSLLTGTPITENINNLYSQMSFLSEKILGYTSYDQFANNHLEYNIFNPKKIIRAHNIEYLSSKIFPYIVEIKKKDVLDLKNKIYESYFCELNNEQEIYYNKAKNILFDNFGNINGVTIYHLLTRLQQISNGILWDYESKKITENKESIPKIKKLMELVESIDDKCIIWTKFNKDLDNIEKEMIKSKKSYCVLNGKMNKKQKDESLNLFKKDRQILISNIQVGGRGFNLTYSNHQIFYSNSFKYALRIQAEDRIYRIGQEKDCYYFDIESGRIDEKIKNSLANKKNIVDEFLDNVNKIKEKEELKKWALKNI